MGAKELYPLQFMFLTVNYILGTTLFVLPRGLIQQGGKSAWLMPWWAGAAGIVIALIWIWLSRHYPGQSLAQIPVKALGRFFGGAVSLLFFFHMCMIAGFVLRNLSDFLNSTILPETPKSVFHIMFLLVACYAAAQGAVNVARFNMIVTPFLFFPFWLAMLAATGNWDWDRVQPVLSSDIWGKMLENHAFIGFPFMEGIVLMMLFPLVRQGGGKALVSGYAVAILSLSAMLFMIVGLLGIERSSRLMFPIYTIVQEAAIGEVVVNIHSVISVVLLSLIFIKLLVLVYAAYECLNQLFRPEKQWPIFLALIILLSGFAQTVYENLIQDQEYVKKYTFVFNSFFSLFLPCLLLAATWIRNAVRPPRGRNASGGSAKR